MSPVLVVAALAAAVVVVRRFPFAALLAAALIAAAAELDARGARVPVVTPAAAALRDLQHDQRERLRCDVALRVAFATRHDADLAAAVDRAAASCPRAPDPLPLAG